MLASIKHLLNLKILRYSIQNSFCSIQYGACVYENLFQNSLLKFFKTFSIVASFLNNLWVLGGFLNVAKIL
jgi:hypothetical protein